MGLKLLDYRVDCLLGIIDCEHRLAEQGNRGVVLEQEIRQYQIEFEVLGGLRIQTLHFEVDVVELVSIQEGFILRLCFFSCQIQLFELEEKLAEVVYNIMRAPGKRHKVDALCKPEVFNFLLLEIEVHVQNKLVVGESIDSDHNQTQNKLVDYLQLRVSVVFLYSPCLEFLAYAAGVIASLLMLMDQITQVKCVAVLIYVVNYSNQLEKVLLAVDFIIGGLNRVLQQLVKSFREIDSEAQVDKDRN